MPLYDFLCPSCDERFEARAGMEERPACPACGSPDAERQLSPFAGPFTVGLRGRAARLSNASRQAREEQRRERRAQRQEEARLKGSGPEGANSAPRPPGA